MIRRSPAPSLISNIEVALLDWIDQAGMTYGGELVDKSDHFFKRGSVYTYLRKLEKRELVYTVKDRNRTLYRIRQKGLNVLAAVRVLENALNGDS